MSSGRTVRRWVHGLSESQISELLLTEMMRAGLVFDGVDLPIVMDGKTRYTKVSGRSKGKHNHKSGWYVGHLGDFPVGQFGWKHGDAPVFTWQLYEHMKENGGGSVEVVDAEAMEKQRIEDEARNKALQLIEHEKRLQLSMCLTTIEYYRSLPICTHPYLTRKNISIDDCGDVRIYNQENYTAQELERLLAAHLPTHNNKNMIDKLMHYQFENIKYRGFNLFLTGRDIDNNLVMFQLIFGKKAEGTGKDKHFPKDLIKQNTFHVLGAPLTDKTTQVIICEGWATGLSIAKFTDQSISVLVAWDSGNMQSVARVIRERMFDCEIFSANDNDHTKTPEKNAGVLGGLKTCAMVGARCITPPFDTNEPDEADFSDWNDIDQSYPSVLAKRVFLETMQAAKWIGASYVDEIDLLSPSEPFKADEVDIPKSFSDEDCHNLSIIWISMVQLIERGWLQCKFDDLRRMELLSERVLLNNAAYSRGEIKARNFDPKIDIMAASILMRFAHQIKINNKNLMASEDIFIPTIKALMRIQKDQTTSLLLVMQNGMADIVGKDLAAACLAMYLDLAGELRPAKKWRRLLLIDITNHADARDLDTGLIYPLIMLQNESEWAIKQPNKDKRVADAADHIRVQYANMISDFLIDKEIILMEQDIINNNHISLH